jgi:hypothetical protein
LALLLSFIAILFTTFHQQISPTNTTMSLSVALKAPVFCNPTRFTYRHTPYDGERGTFVTYTADTAPATPPVPTTLHRQLTGYVHFLPYPADSFHVTPPTEYELCFMTTKVFLGQLPLAVTEMQLVWVCALFGVRVALPQRITRTVDGEKRATGGVHVYCAPADFAALQQNLHKRVLFDDTGLWFAASEEQKRALDSYVDYLHHNKKLRKAGRPYGSVVVQEAQSTYVPRRLLQFDE